MLIAVALFTPSKEIPSWSITDLIPFFDKWVHGLLFLVLAMFLFLAIHKQQSIKHRRLLALWLAPALSAAYGLLTELIQGWLNTGRTADKWDFGADLLGIFAGFFVCLLWKKPLGKPRSDYNGNQKT